MNSGANNKDDFRDADDENVFAELVEISLRWSPGFVSTLKEIGPLNAAAHSTRPLCDFLSRCVIAQQISTRSAETIWQRVLAMVQDHRSDVPNFFTEANRIALRNCGVSSQKADALISIRAAEDRGAICGTHLRTLAAEERSEQLLQVRGIGPWTCDMASLFYFCEPDIWPSTDGALARAVERFLVPTANFRADDTIVDQFKPYRGALARYLYRALDGGL